MIIFQEGFTFIYTLQIIKNQQRNGNLLTKLIYFLKLSDIWLINLIMVDLDFNLLDVNYFNLIKKIIKEIFIKIKILKIKNYIDWRIFFFKFNFVINY